MAINANITFGYDGTDFRRTYSIPLADSLTADSVSAADRNDFVRNAVQAVNASLSAGTDNGLKDFYLADDFDGTNGKFNRITNAEVERDTVDIIYPAANGGNNNG